MNTLDHLRRTLETHATAAPDGFGLAERARTRAVRLRRRRRIFGGTTSALVLAVVAIGVPLVVRGPAAPAPTPAAAPGRTATQLNIGLVPGSAYAVTMRGGDEKAQFATVRPRSASADGGGDVRAHDPGTFDPAALRRGEPVTVGGKAAWYVTELAAVMVLPINRPGIPGPAVGWEEPGGVWVTVGAGRLKKDTRAHLLDVAEDVRLGVLEEAGAPFRFGWLPDGLPVSRTRQNLPGAGYSVTFEFGRADPAPLTVFTLPAGGDGDWPTIRADMPDVTVINGLVTRYRERPSQAWGGPDTGADMAVEAEKCLVYLHVLDRALITRADLTRIVENATFGDCTDPASWQPPIG